MVFWEFLKVGCFSFGGAYSAIPLIRNEVLVNGWMTEDMFTNIAAISEATPGPIMVNMATYVGSDMGGVLGAAIATLGVVLPAFVLILLIAVLLREWINTKPVQAVLGGITPCVVGVIMATGLEMAVSSILGDVSAGSFDAIGLIIFALLAGVAYAYQKVKKKAFSPILLIVIAAVCGAVLYSI